MGLRHFIFTFSSLAFLWCCAGTVSAVIIINEVSPASDPEWVELYNDSDQNVDLSGWLLKDASQKAKLLSGAITAHGYYTYEQSSGWLNNSGTETLSLLDTASPPAIIDSLIYGSADLKSPPDGQCLARSLGGNLWSSSVICTQGQPNGSPPTATPIIPTVTSVPTSTPRPTHTPTLTPSPRPSPTIKPILPTHTIPPQVSPSVTVYQTIVVPSSTPKAVITTLPSIVLGVSTPSSSFLTLVSPMPPPLASKTTNTFWPISLIIAGILIAGVAGGLAYYRRRWYTA